MPKKQPARKGKKQVGEGSSRIPEPAVETDTSGLDSRFSHPEVQLIYHALNGRPILKERPIDIRDRPSLQELIEFHNLSHFYGTPEAIKVSWVQEFFSAGAFEDIKMNTGWRDDHHYVRHQKVKYGEGDISRCLNMEIPPTCEYSALYNHGHFKVSLAEITSVIAKEGVLWPEGKSYLSCSALLSDALFFSEFIRHNIIPSTNRSEVNKTRGLLIYSIMTKKTINFVGIIHRTLLGHIRKIGIQFNPKVDKTKAKKSGGDSSGNKRNICIFPSLITALCLTARVKSLATEGTEPPGLPLHFHEESAPVPSPASKRARPSSSRRTGSSRAASHDIDTLRTEMDQLSTRFDQRMNRMEEMMRAGFAYSRQLALEQDIFLGRGPFAYSEPPTFPPLSAPSPPDDQLDVDDLDGNDNATNPGVDDYDDIEALFED